MTVDFQWNLQTGVYDALTGSGTLQSLISNPVRVFDHTPQDSAFPYLVIGEATTAPFDVKDADGQDNFFMVHTWSRYRGTKELKEIMAAVITALDCVDLSGLIIGVENPLTRFEFSDIDFEQDGLTQHGFQRFRAIYQLS